MSQNVITVHNDKIEITTQNNETIYYDYKKNTNGFLYKDKLGKINLPLPNLLGDFQISNVSTAIATARNLDQFKITDANIKLAITKIRSEGRLQTITRGKLRKYVSKNNEILIDGAHNPLAASAIKKYLETFFRVNRVKINTNEIFFVCF